MYLFAIHPLHSFYLKGCLFTSYQACGGKRFYIQFRLLLGKQFLEFSTKGLAHGTVSHRLITFDTVLQHHNFIYVFFHNHLLFVLSAFRKAVTISFPFLY